MVKKAKPVNFTLSYTVRGKRRFERGLVSATAAFKRWNELCADGEVGRVSVIEAGKEIAFGRVPSIRMRFVTGKRTELVD